MVHPLLVSCIVAYYGGDEAMICASLLHDVVEDTNFSTEDVSRIFGEDVASLVDGLTKIVEIREEELPPAASNQKLVAAALSFRKMLIASIKDIRALVIKLCDRLHNMLTLDALPEKKRIRISEETLVVYAPIAHRLGISSMKNELEDRSFHYIFPEEYKKIDDYFHQNRQAIQLKLHTFIDKVKHLLMSKGMPDSDFIITSRIKRHYSIYLKMQRKGISIEEVLDLLAIRIIVKEPLDCYKALGILHLEFKLSSLDSRIMSPCPRRMVTRRFTPRSLMIPRFLRCRFAPKICTRALSMAWRRTGNTKQGESLLRWVG